MEMFASITSSAATCRRADPVGREHRTPVTGVLSPPTAQGQTGSLGRGQRGRVGVADVEPRDDAMAATCTPTPTCKSPSATSGDPSTNAARETNTYWRRQAHRASRSRRRHRARRRRPPTGYQSPPARRRAPRRRPRSDAGDAPGARLASDRFELRDAPSELGPSIRTRIRTRAGVVSSVRVPETQSSRGIPGQTRTEDTTLSRQEKASTPSQCPADQSISQPCGITGFEMARPGLEPGTPRFSVVTS